MSQDAIPQDGERQTGRAGFCARFVRDRRGSTAIEFAMLAIPFALLVFAILESCISFAGQEVMANITDDIARQMRTGQLRAAGVTGGQLQTLICTKLEIIVAKNCPGLVVDLRTFPTFVDAANASFTITGGDIALTGATPTTPTVNLGGAESVNMLRVFYKWPVMTDFMASSMANLNGGKTLHFASMTWQNEPFN